MTILFERKKCDFCDRECFLIPLNCKGSGNVCLVCRYSHIHVCKFYHKSYDISKIYLPKIVADKIDKI